ncbi:MAG: hypothetical protein GC200_08915 [Tepidisphaera sp.]|nr:hypothetical protein [Tepidisphaera sp.]
MKASYGAIATIAAFLAAAGSARAADTTIKYEVSADGLSWSSNLNALPGTQIQVRARAIWTGATHVDALGEVQFQPIVSNWTAADHLQTTAGTPTNPLNALNPNPLMPGGIGPVGGVGSTPIGSVPDVPGEWGRVTPFAQVATTTSTYLRGFLGTGTASGLLRIAQANITNWVGVGPTSGPGGANNWNAGGGVTAGQVSKDFADTHPIPPFLLGTDVVVFKFGFTLSGATAQRTLSIDTPDEGLRHSTNILAEALPFYGHLVARWYVHQDDMVGTPFYDSYDAAPAFVHVVPAPGMGIVLMAAGLRAGRRRR